jgi:hypothetical protein
MSHEPACQSYAVRRQPSHRAVQCRDLSHEARFSHPDPCCFSSCSQQRSDAAATLVENLARLRAALVVIKIEHQ